MGIAGFILAKDRANVLKSRPAKGIMSVLIVVLAIIAVFAWRREYVHRRKVVVEWQERWHAASDSARLQDSLSARLQSRGYFYENDGRDTHLNPQIIDLLAQRIRSDPAFAKGLAESIYKRTGIMLKDPSMQDTASNQR